MRRNVLVRAAIACCGVLGLGSGCVGDTSSVGDVTVTDSVGIRVVDNGPLPAAPARIAVNSTPLFRLGWVEGEPAFERIRAGRLRSDGTAAVLDDQGTALFLISADGRNWTKIGREGEGPGEFQSGGGLEFMPGDSILTQDYSLGRVSVFDPQGAFARSYMWSQLGASDAQVNGRTSGGGFIWTPFSYAPGMIEPEGGRVWLEAPILLSQPTGDAPDTLLIRPMVETVWSDGRPANDPFVRFSAAAGFSEGVVWAANDRTEIEWTDLEGAVTQVARWSKPPTPVDDAVWSAYGTAWEESPAGRREGAPSADERMGQWQRFASETLPYFRFLAATPRGDVWLSEYTMLGLPPKRFLVVGVDGRVRGEVTFPAPVRLLDVNDSHVLAVEVDEWGVEAVVVYALAG